MVMHLFGPSMGDFNKSLFRKTPDDGDLETYDALRFLNDEGEPVFLHAKGIVWPDKVTRLLSFTTMRGDVEYVMTLDEECMIWSVISGERIKNQPVMLKHRASLT